MNHLPQIRPEIPIAVRTANRCALAIASSPTRKRNVLYLVRSRWSSELAKALATAKRRGGILVISTISRLGRRVSFVARLMEQKDVPFTCADAPDDEPFIFACEGGFRRRRSPKTYCAHQGCSCRREGAWKKAGDACEPHRRCPSSGRGGQRSARARQAIIRPKIAAARAQGLSMRAIAERVGVATAAVLPHTACGVVEWAGSSSLTTNRSPQRVGSTRARYYCDRRKGCITVVSMKSKKICCICRSGRFLNCLRLNYALVAGASD